jgi:pimeloyl-ACP methyl ester carboxylesterase
MAVGEGLPMVLLPGLAADERLFAPQLARFPDLRVPAWIDPLRVESLRAYAARLARVVDPGKPCIVGGASFGGTVALEMAPHLRAAACVLIGSIRSPSEIPWRWRVLRPIVLLGADRLGVLAGFAARFGGRFLAGGTVRRLQRLSQPRASFARWAMCAVVRWWPRQAARRVRVFRIHGAADRTLPVGLTRPDVVVSSGGHALSLFSPEVVNEFLAGVVQQVVRNHLHEFAR